MAEATLSMTSRTWPTHQVKARPITVQQFSMEANEDTWRNEELSKLHFEFFKHLSTLGVASALAVLAVYRDLVAESFILGVSLLAFALCVFAPLFGMIEAITRFERSTPPARRYKRMEAVALVSFSTGVLASVDGALSNAFGIPLGSR